MNFPKHWGKEDVMKAIALVLALGFGFSFCANAQEANTAPRRAFQWDWTLHLTPETAQRRAARLAKEARQRREVWLAEHTLYGHAFTPGREKIWYGLLGEAEYQRQLAVKRKWGRQ